MNKLLIISSLLLIFKTQAQTSVVTLGDSLYATGNYSKAIEQYKLYGQPDDVYEYMAKSYLALGNYDEALLNYQKALTAHPENVLLKFETAKLLAKRKDYTEASRLFKQLVSQDGNNPNYQYELGVTLEALKDSTAMEHYKVAFELDSTHQKAIYKIAREFLVERNYEASLNYIHAGLGSYPNNVELISLKAQNYYWKEDYREAAKWFEKLIELGESSQFIHEKLCFCYAQHFDYKKAAEQGELAVQCDPQNWTNLFILGQMYEGMEDFENASKYMKMALEIRDVPLDDAYRKLGYVLNRQGNYKEAIDVLNKSLKINPDNEMTQFYLLMAKDKYYKDVETRLKLYEDFSNRNPNSNFNFWIERRIKELKEEKFLKGED